MADPKRIEDMSLPELLDQIGGGWPGGALMGRIQTAITVRLAEQQDAAARALVGATATLGTTTARLVYATWGLVGATLILVLAEVVLKVFWRS